MAKAKKKSPKTKKTMSLKSRTSARAQKKVSPKAKTKVTTKAKANTKTKDKLSTKASKTASKNKTSAQVIMTTINPLEDRVLIVLTEREKKTAGGLYIPDTAASTSGQSTGKVIVVGPGKKNKKGHLKPLDVQPGDQVVFSEHAGDRIQIDGKECILLRETEIMGVRL